MLELFTKHGGFDLTLQANGDLDVDQHHTVEDVGIVLGQLFAKALGDRKGINRAGYFVLPMDETLAVVAVDLGGRPALVYNDLVRVRLVGDLQTELVRGFLRRLRAPRRRERARQGAVRPLESSQDRGDLQVLRARDEVRLLDGRAAERPTSVDKGAVYDRDLRLRRRQSALRAEHARRDRRALHAGATMPKDCAAPRKIILPGVGHFGQMMRRSTRWACAKRFIERIRAGVPFLGICLGLQALFERSEEAPEIAGLGIFPAQSSRFPPDARVPHMGWNDARAVRPSRRLLQGLPAKPYVYFAHSYYVPVMRAQPRRPATYTRPYTVGARTGQRLRRAVPSREVRSARTSESCAISWSYRQC